MEQMKAPKNAAHNETLKNWKHKFKLCTEV